MENLLYSVWTPLVSPPWCQTCLWEESLLRKCGSSFHLEKSCIKDPELDRDSYHWIIIYIQKARNNKTVRGIDKDPNWSDTQKESAKSCFQQMQQFLQFLSHQIIVNSQALCLKNICLVDGSWTCTSKFSGCWWVWKNMSGQTPLMGMRNLRSAYLEDRVYVKSFKMPEFWMRLQGLNHHHYKTSIMAKLLKWTKEIKTLQRRFQSFKLSYILRRQDYWIGNFVMLVILFQLCFSCHLLFE